MKIRNILSVALFVIFTKASVFGQATMSYTDGKPIMSMNSAEIQGTVYLSDTWTPGFIKLENGKTYTQTGLKYDELNDQIYFLGPDDVIMQFKDPVREFTLTSVKNLNGSKATFRNGYPAASNTTSQSYFQVLADGKAQFLKKNQKQIMETKEYNSASSVKTVMDNIRYYIYTNNKLSIVKKDKKSILEALSDKQSQLEEFIKTNNISFKDEASIASLVTYYNSI